MFIDIKWHNYKQKTTGSNGIAIFKLTNFRQSCNSLPQNVVLVSGLGAFKRGLARFAECHNFLPHLEKARPSPSVDDYDLQFSFGTRLTEEDAHLETLILTFCYFSSDSMNYIKEQTLDCEPTMIQAFHHEQLNSIKIIIVYNLQNFPSNWTRLSFQ